VLAVEIASMTFRQGKIDLKQKLNISEIELSRTSAEINAYATEKI